MYLHINYIANTSKLQEILGKTYPLYQGMYVEVCFEVCHTLIDNSKQTYFVICLFVVFPQTMLTKGYSVFYIFITFLRRKV